MRNFHRGLVISIIGIIVLVGSIVLVRNQTPTSKTQASGEQTVFGGAFASEVSKNNELVSVHSPDGTMNITMVAVHKNTDQTSYVFSTSKIGDKPIKIYEATLPASSQMSLSRNSWSPDNRYVFITKRTAAGPGALVFGADGAPFGDAAFIDVTAEFLQDVSEYTIRDITGWDSETLLHVLTYDGQEKGPPYWFEIPSAAAIQLYE